MEKKGLKVVLADNNVQDRETRTKAIEEAGMQVVFSTGDGKKALDAIYREQPDIVVMDMILPGLDGIGILEEIEKVDMLHRPVTMIVTALKASQMVSRALQRGAGYYMMKPISNKVFGERLQQIAEEMKENSTKQDNLIKSEQEYAVTEYAAAEESMTIKTEKPEGEIMWWQLKQIHPVRRENRDFPIAADIPEIWKRM